LKDKVLIGNDLDPINMMMSAPESDFVGVKDVQVLENKLLTDSTTCFQDTKETKRAQFCLNGVTAGVNRVLNLPDANTTLLGTDNKAVISNKIIDISNVVHATHLGPLKIVDKCSDGYVLTVNGDEAVWKRPESTFEAENIGNIGGGVFVQKINGTMNFRKLHSYSQKITVVEHTGGKILNFDINEKKINRNDFSEVLAVEHGGTGVGVLPMNCVVVGGGAKVKCEMPAPRSDFVGIDDKQALTRKFISGKENDIEAGSLYFGGNVVKLGGNTPEVGQVITCVNKTVATWKSLPEPPKCVNSIGKDGEGVVARFKDNSYIFRKITGGEHIDVKLGNDTITLEFDPKKHNLNTGYGVLDVKHGGVGMKIAPVGKVLVGAGDTWVAEMDVPESDFVGVKDHQKLTHKVLLDPTNEVCANFLRAGKSMVGLGNSPKQGQVLTAMNDKKAEWCEIPDLLKIENLGEGIEVCTEKDGHTLRFRRLALASNCMSMDVDENTDEIVFDVVEENVDINRVGGVLSVAKGGTGAESFGAGNVLIGDDTKMVTASKKAPTGAFVGTIDQQTLFNKVLRDTTNIVSATFLRTTTGDIDITSKAPEEGWILTARGSNAAEWRPPNEDNPEIQKYRAMFQPVAKEVSELKSANNALKLALRKAQLNISNLLERMETLENRVT